MMFRNWDIAARTCGHQAERSLKNSPTAGQSHRSIGANQSQAMLVRVVPKTPEGSEYRGFSLVVAARRICQLAFSVVFPVSSLSDPSALVHGRRKEETKKRLHERDSNEAASKLW